MARRDPLAGQSDFLPPTTDLNVLDRANAQPPDLALHLLQTTYLAKGLEGDALNISDTLVPVAQIRPWVLDRAVRHELQQPFWDWNQPGGNHSSDSQGTLVDPVAATVLAVTDDLSEGAYDMMLTVGGTGVQNLHVTYRDAANIGLLVFQANKPANETLIMQWGMFFEEGFDLTVSALTNLIGTFRSRVWWRRRFGPTIIP